MKLCQAYRREYGCDFISVQPTNLYGPGDNFDPPPATCPRPSQALPRAKLLNRSAVVVWGTGTRVASSSMLTISRTLPFL